MKENSVYKILIIDDNPAIFADICKILLKQAEENGLEALEEKLFGEKKDHVIYPKYEIHSASQGQQGVKLIKEASQKGDPYTLAFVDIRMPSGWDGIETIERIWKVDKDVQVVICTAYSDYTWEETIGRLGTTDNLLILKKPFDTIAVHQLAFALTKKWQLSKDAERSFQLLEEQVKQRTTELNKSLSLVKATLDSASDGILVINNSEDVVDYNNKFLELMNSSGQQQLTKENVFVVISQLLESPSSYLERFNNIKNWDENEFIVLRLKNGKVYEQYSSPQVINNKVIGNVFSFRDVTERFRHEEALHYQATHDSLTQLPNRILMFDKLQQAIAHANQNKTKVGVLFFDIDRFKVINDSLGHKVGDLVLQNMGMRLTSAVRKKDIVSRIGGDEFVVLITNLSDVTYVYEIAKKLLARINEPFSLASQTIIINASIGISIYPDDGITSSDLLKNADAAMYQTKSLGGNSYMHYTPEMDSQGVKYLEMEIELNNAIKRREFILHYQPQIDLKTRRIVAAEALIRWAHPEKGLLGPHEFIPFAEKTGIISKIGDWVLRTACKQNKLWQKMGLNKIVIAVNMSNFQLKSKKIVDKIRNILIETELDPECLELELTESYLITDENIVEKIKQIKELGVKIALDDFGTGYSNFNYLKTIPVDKIKIDRSFIQDVYQDKDKESIVLAIMSIAHSLNLKITAEGVETVSDLNFLKAHECSYAQGYYFSKPLTNTSFTWLLKKRNNIEHS
jgi:diguanylate cyclase (GGDEF)-like protein/PAS domain S-box-containing protein